MLSASLGSMSLPVGNGSRHVLQSLAARVAARRSGVSSQGLQDRLLHGERVITLVKAGEEEMATSTETSHTAEPRLRRRQAFVQGVHGVRYQVTDVARSVAFYTTHLGFTLTHQQLPAFASVSLGDAQILLSGPEASGSL